MRLSTSAIAFCVGFLLNQGAVAVELPQSLVEMSARFYPDETAKAKSAP